MSVLSSVKYHMSFGFIFMHITVQMLLAAALYSCHLFFPHSALALFTKNIHILYRKEKKKKLSNLVPVHKKNKKKQHKIKYKKNEKNNFFSAKRNKWRIME